MITAIDIGDQLLVEHSSKRDLIISVIFGQLLSFMVALTALFTKVLNDNYDISSPALQDTIGYSVVFLIALYPCGILNFNFRKDFDHKMVLGLFLIAIADSQAAFFDNLAYNFSVSIASVGMLSSFTIPCVMCISYCFLKLRYLKNHYLGTGIALIGLIFVIFSDVLSSSDAEMLPIDDSLNGSSTDATTVSSTIIGDFLIIVGSGFYAVSNVATEAFVKSRDIWLYLTWLGFFGALISLIQFLSTELSFWSDYQTQTDKADPGIVAMLLILFGFTFSLIYLGAAKFLAKYDAVVFNLSLLSTDVWGLVFGYFIFEEEVSALKLIGFVSIVIGVYIYNTRPPVKSLEQHVPIQAQEEGWALQELS